MPHKTEYLNIHEKAYRKLQEKGAASWSDSEDFSGRAKAYLAAMKKHNVISHAPILILGCGDGETSILLAKEGLRVTGVDISPTAIEWAREKAACRDIAVDFQELNLATDPYPSMKFQVIIDDHCLHCIIGNDRQQILSKTQNALETNGLFILRTHCGDPPADATDFLKMWDPESRCQVFEGVAGRYFGRQEDLIKEVEAAGFSLLEQKVESQGWQILEAIFRAK